MNNTARATLRAQVRAQLADMPYIQVRGLMLAGELELDRPTRWVKSDAVWHLLVCEAYTEAQRREKAAANPWELLP